MQHLRRKHPDGQLGAFLGRDLRISKYSLESMIVRMGSGVVPYSSNTF